MDRKRIVAGIDVHKDSVYLCIMRYDEAIIFEKTYGTLTTQLRQMRGDMLGHGVMECAMESTSGYWVPVWNGLCEHMRLRLANPHFIKQLPGRKSDTKDAQWIAECQLKNLIRESFVPNPIVQDMRKLNRRIFDLNEDMTYNKNKLDAAMQRCGFRLSNYASQTGGKSYQSVVRTIASGTTAPEKLITHGNKYLRQMLIEISWVASRTRNCFFSNFSYTQVTVKKKSKMKIQVAIARKILVAVWHMLSKEEDFIDLYLKRLQEQEEIQAQITEIESSMTV